jgi:hypothetical protein
MHRPGRNYFQRMRFLTRRLETHARRCGLSGRDDGQPDQQGAIAAIMVGVEEDVRRRCDQQFLRSQSAPHREHPGVGKVRFILEPTEIVQSAIGKTRSYLDFPGGCSVIRYKGVDQPYRTFDKIRQVKQMAIVENKRRLLPASESRRLYFCELRSNSPHPVTGCVIGKFQLRID